MDNATMELRKYRAFMQDHDFRFDLEAVSTEPLPLHVTHDWISERLVGVPNDDTLKNYHNGKKPDDVDMNYTARLIIVEIGLFHTTSFGKLRDAIEDRTKLEVAVLEALKSIRSALDLVYTSILPDKEILRQNYGAIDALLEGTFWFLCMFDSRAQWATAVANHCRKHKLGWIGLDELRNLLWDHPQWNKTYEAGTRQLSPRIRKKKGPVRFVLDPEYIAEYPPLQSSSPLVSTSACGTSTPDVSDSHNTNMEDIPKVSPSKKRRLPAEDELENQHAPQRQKSNHQHLRAPDQAQQFPSPYESVGIPVAPVAPMAPVLLPFPISGSIPLPDLVSSNSQSQFLYGYGYVGLPVGPMAPMVPGAPMAPMAPMAPVLPPFPAFGLIPPRNPLSSNPQASNRQASNSTKNPDEYPVDLRPVDGFKLEDYTWR